MPSGFFIVLVLWVSFSLSLVLCSTLGMAEEDIEEGYDQEEKWAKHYSSNHQILLVGDGDFSFSLSLARSFGSASNIVATSLDPYDVVIKKYKEAKSNLESLKNLGASLLHRVNATTMKWHTDLKMRKFDRIIFNFPHAGFRGKEDNILVINNHRSLVHDFFQNARGLLRHNGEIHINHKTTAPFCCWDLVELASQSSLTLTEHVEFKIEDYPGYKNKRGDGPRCDEPFRIGESSTFKFGLCPSSKKMQHRRQDQFQVQNLCTSCYLKRSQMGPHRIFKDITDQPLQRPTSLDHIRGTNPNFDHVGFPLIGPAVRNWEEQVGSFARSFHRNLIEIRGRACHDVPFNHGNGTHLLPEIGQRTFYDLRSHSNEYKYGGFNMIMNPERTLNQDMHILPQCNGRTWYDGGHCIRDSRFGFDRDMMSMHTQRESKLELRHTAILSLIRKFGNQDH